MSDQADKLRQLACQASRPERGAKSAPAWIAITGGRAGVGATTTAVNLAAALVDADLRVIVVDSTSSGRGLLRVAGFDANASEATAVHMGPAGIRFLVPGHNSTGGLPDSRRVRQAFQKEIEKMTADADVVLVDTGSGVSTWTRRVWRQSRLALVVTTPDDAAVMDSYATIKLASDDADVAELAVVMNQCDRPAVAGEVLRRLASACERFLGRTMTAAPSLPRYATVSRHDDCPPRVWQAPASTFGQAVLWLGRYVIDVLARGEVDQPFDVDCLANCTGQHLATAG
jgi:MinD-like ATPase involved in chromosome partitioning or flagellar assembly